MIIDSMTSETENILLLLSLSLKKIYPKKTLRIGIIKYPKLASIILSVATAYIHTAQLIKINNPEKNNPIKFFLFLIIEKKIFNLEKKNFVIIKFTTINKNRSKKT